MLTSKNTRFGRKPPPDNGYSPNFGNRCKQGKPQYQQRAENRPERRRGNGLGKEVDFGAAGANEGT